MARTLNNFGVPTDTGKDAVGTGKIGRAHV